MEPSQILPSIEVEEVRAEYSNATSTASSNNTNTPKVAPRQRSVQSPPPASDPRISAWRAEQRTFKGKIVQSSALQATRTALAAQKAGLWVKGNPQFAIFCDGSCRSTQVSQFHGTKGGYGVVFRDPYEPDDRDIDLAFNKNQLRSFEESERDGLREDD
ncbi:hypothetical protein QBC45DRAFT_216447 [Copromyces sp. CBS 386.78]|nr:hypothetical protein QBC45DRAFT_216447 [Copromyces sp. CBS 386.78]